MEKAFYERFGPDSPKPAPIDPIVAAERFVDACERLGLQVTKFSQPHQDSVLKEAFLAEQTPETEHQSVGEQSSPLLLKVEQPSGENQQPNMPAPHQKKSGGENQPPDVSTPRHKTASLSRSISPDTLDTSSSLSALSATPATVRIPAKKMPPTTFTHYDQTELKSMGKMCGNRLPPASAVQAMFLYEMQRESELEKLFQGQMFRLAKAEDESSAQQAKTVKLEHEIVLLRNKIQAQALSESAAAQKARMDAQQAEINEQSERINDQQQLLGKVVEKVESQNGSASELRITRKVHATSISELQSGLKSACESISHLQASEVRGQDAINSIKGRLSEVQRNVMQAADQAGASAITRETLDNSLSILHSANDAFNGEVAALEDELKTVRSENASLKTSNEALQTSTTAINEDVGVLFDERDMLVSTVAAATTRIENLETLVRALTGQSISSAGSMGSPSPQTLPVKTSNGAKLDLAVPKGKPLVERDSPFAFSRNENANGFSRSFEPGKPWASTGSTS